MSAAYRYKAFLSYSHQDHKAASWLHNALEKYRLPEQLQAAYASKTTHQEHKDEIPGKLGRIFRDRDELPAADDLTAEVKKALQSSEFMIVLCSPRAAASRWVNKEVIEFKKLRGDAFVLPIILEGEPGASVGGQGGADEECFPPAVRFKLGADGQLSRKRAEPIAADIRKSGDGRQRALLKVIAGLLGVGLDQLVEREMQRKQRRVIAITAASIIGMLVMGVLTTQAITARREAEVNRAQAEDLVEFMLTDLREKLDAVGRLDVLDSVGEKAVAYYDAQPVSGMADGSIGRRARAFHLLGEVEERRGDMDSAQAMFDRAKNATAALLARSPNDPQRIFDHSQSVFWAGYLDWKRGNFSETLVAFTEYQQYAEQLVAIDPENPGWQMELGYAYGNMGALQLRSMNQPRAAYKNYAAAADIHEKLIAADPGDLSFQFSHAENYAWMGDALRQFGHADEAMAARLQQQEILAKILVGDPQHKAALKQLAISYAGLGWIAFYQGDAKAQVLFKKAADIADRLVASDPENKNWQGIQGNNHLRLVVAYLTFGQPKMAAAVFEKNEHLFLLVPEKNIENIEQRIYQGLYRPLVAMRLRASTQGFSAVKDDAVRLLEKAITDELAIVANQHGRRTIGDVYMLAVKSLIAAGESAEAHRLLGHLWAGQTVLGRLKFDAEQDPRWVNIVAEIAYLRGDKKLLEQIKKEFEKRGYRLPFQA